MNVHAKFCFASLLVALVAGCGGGGADSTSDADGQAAGAATDAAQSKSAAGQTDIAPDPGSDTAVFTEAPIQVPPGDDEAYTAAASPSTVTASASTQSPGSAAEDFESGFTSLPAGWSINWWGTRPNYTVGPETRSGYTHAGAGALRLQVGTVASNSGLNLVYSRGISKAGSYDAQAYLRTDNANGANVEVQLRRNAAPYDVVARKQLVLGTSWQKVHLSAAYPFPDAGSLRVVSLTANANVYIDDVAISPMASAEAVANAVVLPAAGGSSVEVTPVKTTTMDEAYTTYAPGWTYNYWGPQKPTFSASRETEPGHVYAGAASQKFQITNKNGGEVQLVSRYAFTKGKTYRAVVYLRSDVATPVQVTMRRDTQPYDNFAAKSVTVDTNWQKVEIEGTYLATSDGSMRIALKNASGTLWVDEAVIAEVKRNDFAPYNASAAIPDTLFGMHVNKLGTHDKWPGMSTRILRLWNTGTTWRDLEPTQDGWNWTTGGGMRMDMYVNYVARNAPGAQILYTLGQTPLWASSTPDVNGQYGMGSSGVPRNMDDWRDYVRTLARRYVGKIRYWEIWNEPDYVPHYNGTPAQMVEMTRIAREELLAADPANKIVSPGLTKGQGMQFLDYFFAAGGGNYVDMVGYHWYYWIDPEMVGPMVDNLRVLMTTYGLQAKPIWMTEGAFYCDTTQTDCSTATPTLEQSRSTNARAMFTMAVKGVANFNFHVWEASDAFRQLVQADFITQTEAGKAYAEARSWAFGARVVDSFRAGSGVYVVRLTRGGVDSFVLWSTVDGETVAIPGAWNVNTVRSITQTESPLPSTRQLRLGLEPVLLKP
ncbi:glycosyl hydrolase [Rubrivivax gelatinosus]|uniref:Putative glycoside hydrolase n=1 Tax=Rubrivivax gelatinosus (strain NBRC 100245 / IL144) TaxID=983917 RepID=I0HN36_RUBGI|nr:glycosyl hydrolase [Rubrivivax gelatinosus]BAL94423.1 putative glycoside hydrolase [Rubrivivax gelatinosus IL144]